MAEELQNELQAIPNTNRVWVIGGRPRRIRVELDPVRLAARRTSALQVAQALQASNVNVRAGEFRAAGPRASSSTRAPSSATPRTWATW